MQGRVGQVACIACPNSCCGTFTPGLGIASASVAFSNIHGRSRWQSGVQAEGRTCSCRTQQL